MAAFADTGRIKEKPRGTGLLGTQALRQRVRSHTVSTTRSPLVCWRWPWM